VEEVIKKFVGRFCYCCCCVCGLLSSIIPGKAEVFMLVEDINTVSNFWSVRN
jgi:hypothetical protein